MILRTLGGLELEGADFHRPKPLLLLAYLVLEGARERRYLAELFWSRAANPRQSLATALYQLHGGVPGAIETAENWVQASIRCDAIELLGAVEESRMMEAVELHRGPFVSGVDLKGWGVELEEWVYETREFLAVQARKACLGLAEEVSRRGEFKVAVRHAERALLMPGAGELELGEMERLYTLLLAGGSVHADTLRREAQAYGLSLELSREEAQARLREVVPGEGSIPSVLPPVVTSFVGRDVELAKLKEQLFEAECRLITLVGPGGVGKSRLALRLAREELRGGRFKDGVYFIELDSLTDASLIPSQIAQLVGLSVRGSDEVSSQVVRQLKTRELLLVLDNFEQLMEGVGFASELVRSCPTLKVVVTSRERLNVMEEWLYPLGGLAVPKGDATHEEAGGVDAVRLFVQRARRADPSFSFTKENAESVWEICRLVEGFPLGIELAAAWVRLIPLPEIAGEIERNIDFLTNPTRNVAGRHRSLRATFEHSWNLLSSNEQSVLRRLSVFRGGFRREAAAEVVGATIPVLASLVDKSLMRVLASGRFDRHPLLYQYTEEKLAEHPGEQQAVQERHAQYFLSLAEEAEAKSWTVEDPAWLERLDEEHDNLRLALGWAVETGNAKLGLQLTGALWRFWRIRGYLYEGRAWLTRALALPAAVEWTAERAKALQGAGELAKIQSDFPLARDLIEESLVIRKALGNKLDIVESLLSLVGLVGHTDFYRKSSSLLEESLERARELGDKYNIAEALRKTGDLEFGRGEWGLARSLLEESLKVARDLGNKKGISHTLHTLALLFKQQGDYELARLHFEECLAINREIGDKERISFTLLNLGDLSYRESDFARAYALYEESLGMMRELGNLWGLGHVLNNLGNVLLVQGDHAAAHEQYEESLKVRREIGDEIGAAGALIKLGSLSYYRGDFARARSLLEEALATARALGHKVVITAHALQSLGWVACAEKDLASARVLFKESLTIMEGVGDKKGVAVAHSGLGLVACAENDEISAQAHYRESLTIHRSLGDRHGVAVSLEGMASSVSRGEPERAARLWGAAEKLREAIRAPLLLIERSRYEQEVSAVRCRLDDLTFVTAWSQGREKPLDQADALVLEGNRQAV
ncbi:MAG: tetratricopeptide repeat protein [Trueperaceae bacterium]|nr:MAG: tetratricopeptide repeat protein [Trueperaceae bacterium]